MEKSAVEQAVAERTKALNKLFEDQVKKQYELMKREVAKLAPWAGCTFGGMALSRMGGALSTFGAVLLLACGNTLPALLGYDRSGMGEAVVAGRGVSTSPVAASTSSLVLNMVSSTEMGTPSAAASASVANV